VTGTAAGYLRICPHCGETLETDPAFSVVHEDPPAIPTSGRAEVVREPAPPAPSAVHLASNPPPTPATPRAPPVRPPIGPVAPARVAPAGTRSRTSGWRNLLPVRIWKRYFPPVRLVWIFLLVIVWNGDGFLNRTIAWPLLFLPLTAAMTDLGFQAARFPKLRIPDAAIANGLFLSVILWPATVSIELTAIAVATVGVRHLLRFAGHPIFNPAALGVTLAAVVFAIPQPWHVGLTLRDTELVAALGLLLWSKAWHTWRLWVVFFATNIAATLLLADYLAGSSVLPLVIQTSVLGATPVFYGFFMVTEPRTAPSARRAMIIYGALVGVSAAVFPVLFAEYPTYSAFGVLTPYLALFLGNVFAVALPSARGSRRPSSARAEESAKLTASSRASSEPTA
jgi:enediyne biosynthesis protein E5